MKKTRPSARRTRTAPSPSPPLATGREQGVGPAARPTCARLEAEVLRLRDITERKQAEKTLQHLNRTLQAHISSHQARLRAKDETEYLQEVCRVVVKDCGHAMVWIGYAEQDDAKSVRPVAQAGFEEGYLRTLKITWADTERGRGPTGTAVRTGKAAGCKDMLTDPGFRPWRAEALKRGYASSLALPLLAKGRAFGVITIYSAEPAAFSDLDVKLLENLADDLAHGITTFRLRQAHEKAMQALRESEERYRLLADNAEDFVMLHHISGKRLYISPSCFRITGWSLEELEATDWRARVHVENLPAVEQAHAANLRGEVTLIEYRSLCKDGSWIWLESRCQPLAGADRKVQRMVVWSHNITKRKQAQLERERLQQALAEANACLERQVEERTRELSTTNAKLREKILERSRLEAERQRMEEIARGRERLAMLGELAAGIAHEMRNPLQGVLGFTDLAKRKAKGNGDLGPLLERIEEGLHDMDRVAGQLLDLSRQDQEPSGASSLEPVIEKSWGLLQMLATKRGVILRQSFEAGLPPVQVDEGRLIEVFLNLLKNSLDACNNGGVITVQARALREREGPVEVLVRDDGPGIPAEIRERVFEPFFTTKPHGTGTGLGLAIVKRIVEGHGGRIALVHEGGRGTTIAMTLPTKAVPAPRTCADGLVFA